jgi:serine phosphatase RsbU (regulator of sigma subunit)
VPSLADYCSVDLVGPRGGLERVAAKHRDPTRHDLVEQLRGLSDAPAAPGAAARVLLTGTSELYEHVGGEQLAAVARDGHHLDLLRELGLRSVLIVPLRVPARTIGLMTLATDQSRRLLTHDDVELAEQLGRRAAVAVENSRLHTELASVAATLQQSLLPAEPPEIPTWEVAALYRPAQIEQRIDVGGDFYEFYNHDGRWFVIIGDVAGKGVKAASLTALMRHGARIAFRSNPSPAAILSELDEALAQHAGSELCTALCMCVHDDHLVMSSAGHPPALIVGRDGATREAPATGPLLGAFADSTWPEETVELTGGELVVLYTDGVTETPGPTDRFGIGRLEQLLRRLAGQSPAEVLSELDAALDAFAGEVGRDDVAALALRRRPAPRGYLLSAAAGRGSTTTTRSNSKPSSSSTVNSSASPAIGSAPSGERVNPLPVPAANGPTASSSRLLDATIAHVTGPADADRSA